MNYYENISNDRNANSVTTRQEWIMAIPRLAALALKLGFDKRVPWETKSALGLALLYIISPIDGIPDFIPVVGQLEDILIAVVVIDGMVNHIDRSIVLEHWSGKPGTLDAIGKMTSKVTNMMPSFIRNRVMKKAFRNGWNKPGNNGRSTKEDANRTGSPFTDGRKIVDA